MINWIEEYNNVNIVKDNSVKIFARGELESHRGSYIDKMNRIIQ